MKIEAIRLDCLAQAIYIKSRCPMIPQSEQEIAEAFAEFCKDDEVAVDAIRMAVKAVKPRSTVEDVLQKAYEFGIFAHNQPKKETGTRRGRRSR